MSDLFWRIINEAPMLSRRKRWCCFIKGLISERVQEFNSSRDHMGRGWADENLPNNPRPRGGAASPRDLHERQVGDSRYGRLPNDVSLPNDIERKCWWNVVLMESQEPWFRREATPDKSSLVDQWRREVVGIDVTKFVQYHHGELARLRPTAIASIPHYFAWSSMEFRPSIDLFFPGGPLVRPLLLALLH